MNYLFLLAVLLLSACASVDRLYIPSACVSVGHNSTMRW